MRRYLLFLLCYLFLTGCASTDRYDSGYSAGYAAGYEAALAELESRAVPEITPAPTSMPHYTPSPRFTVAPTAAPSSDDFTVYVSRSGTMHLKENCSGMTHSTAMPYSVASQYYDKRCSNCFKKVPS